MKPIELVGRSSSHFTRVARIFAIELDVPHTFRPLLDLTSLDTALYAGNPALKIPVLVDEDGPLFGTENVCRALVRRAGATRVVLRGEGVARVVANAEELVLQAMTTEVTLILAKLGGQSLPVKVTKSLENSLEWLDAHVDEVRAALPSDRTVSLFEAMLFALATHLPFRDVLDVARFERLAAFCARFGERPSAQATAYRYDAA